jgi:YD repeat-containing protein
LLSAHSPPAKSKAAVDVSNRLTSEHEPFGLVLTFNYDSGNNRTLVQDSLGQPKPTLTTPKKQGRQYCAFP